MKGTASVLDIHQPKADNRNFIEIQAINYPCSLRGT